MINRNWYFVLPLTAAFGGGALAIGLVPGVRQWVNGTFPQLGIEGQTTLPSKSEMLTHGSLKNIDKSYPDLQPDSPADQYSAETGVGTLDQSIVRFAQATIPSEQTRRDPSPTLPVRFAQSQSSEILQVPRTGINVPAGNNQTSLSRGGVLMVPNAQLRFPQDILIVAQSEGLITELNVDDGSAVKAGQVMVCLDPRIAEAEANVSRQELLAAEIKLKDDSSVRYAKAAVEVAKVELEISDDLNGKGAEGDLDNRKKRLELTKAQLQITVSENEKEQQSAAVDLQKAKLAATQVQVELRKIPARWDGFISEVAKKQYSFVRPGEVICRLTSMETIRVIGNAEVDIAPHMLLNAPARVRISVPGMQDAPVVEGIVSYISPRSESPRKYPIHVNIANQLTKDGQYLFREGMEATIEVTVGAR